MLSDFKEISHARKILGLRKNATIQEIKAAYRKQAMKYHPDTCAGRSKKRCAEKFKEINHAHTILMAYCLRHKTALDMQEVKRNTLGKEYYDHLRRFYDGWWGDLDL